MPENGAGVWERTPGTRIANQGALVSAQVNDETDNLINGLNAKPNLDGKLPFTAVQTIVPGTAAAHAASVGQVQSSTLEHSTSVGGTVDAITIVHSPVRTAWVTGMRGTFTAAGANVTTTPTLNPDGIGAKTFLKSNLQALVPGDISGAGHEVEWEYNGTNVIILNPAVIVLVDGQTITSTDAGAGEGPVINLDRFSASPAAADVIGATAFLGRSSTAVSRAYARIRASIKTATNAAEDGLFAIRTMLAGTEADRIIVGAGLYTALATGGDKGADTVNASAVYDDGVQILPITIATEQATTSGTSIDFTGIPATAKRITVMFDGVSTNGTSDLLIQIGDSGGIETSGYLSTASQIANAGSTSATSAVGFVVAGLTAAASVFSGSVVLTLQDASNTWTSAGILKSSTTLINLSAGAKATSATLDRIRLTTTNGVDTFDAGSVSISYE